MTRIQAEQRRLKAMLREFQPANLALAIIVAQQTLLWAGDTERAGYIAPSKFIAFAKKMKAPHKSLHPTEQRRRR
jgi:hypothetical protein